MKWKNQSNSLFLSSSACLRASQHKRAFCWPCWTLVEPQISSCLYRDVQRYHPYSWEQWIERLNWSAQNPQPFSYQHYTIYIFTTSLLKPHWTIAQLRCIKSVAAAAPPLVHFVGALMNPIPFFAMFQMILWQKVLKNTEWINEASLDGFYCGKAVGT